MTSTPSDTGELVERLTAVAQARRENAKRQLAALYPEHQGEALEALADEEMAVSTLIAPVSLITQAAQALTALQAENERLRDVLETLTSSIVAAWPNLATTGPVSNALSALQSGANPLSKLHEQEGVGAGKVEGA